MSIFDPNLIQKEIPPDPPDPYDDLVKEISGEINKKILQELKKERLEDITMSVFGEDIYLDERDILKQKVYEEWIQKLIVAGAAVIEQLDKVYVVETKFL